MCVHLRIGCTLLGGDGFAKQQVQGGGRQLQLVPLVTLPWAVAIPGSTLPSL